LAGGGVPPPSLGAEGVEDQSPLGIGKRLLEDRGPRGGGHHRRRQVGDVDQRPGAEQHRAVDGMLEFTHVSRPAVVFERRARGRGETLDHAPMATAGRGAKGLRQQQHVGPAVAERRQFDGDDVDPPVEVLTEAPRGDERRQVLVGGEHDAHVDTPCPAAAHRLEPPLLQHAQQSHLQRGGRGGDLVEKDRAPVRFDEPARPIGMGTGERPGDMAEQLAVEERFGEASARHLHQRSRCAGTGGVQAAGEQRLAGTAFSGDEDRRVAAGDPRRRREGGDDSRIRAEWSNDGHTIARRGGPSGCVDRGEQRGIGGARGDDRIGTVRRGQGAVRCADDDRRSGGRPRRQGGDEPRYPFQAAIHEAHVAACPRERPLRLGQASGRPRMPPAVAQPSRLGRRRASIVVDDDDPSRLMFGGGGRHRGFRRRG